ncbi:MAG: serine--tRNA ligase [Chlamydiae bacterium]|jgi:seryl-tRNA synthetase|nr:serine--tRNA ligase [Chlamydiota bacterium]
MLNIKQIIKEPKLIEERLKRKDPNLSLDPLLKAYDAFCKSKIASEEAVATLNRLSKEIGEKKRQGIDTTSMMESVINAKQAAQTLSEKQPALEREYETLLSELPNLPDDDIKISPDPKENVCIKMHGEKKSFNFPLKNHVELGESLDLFDFKRGAKISGAGWPVYKGLGARLEWALLNMMIETHIKNGFTFHLVPHLVRPQTMYGSGQLPKFEKQLFKLTDDDYDLFLIPTSEVSLNGLHSDEVIPDEDLPKLYTSYTPCFRREAGSHGKAERGLIRVHQFNKVEMFAFTKPEDSDLIFEKMMKSAEEVLEKLELHYRNMLLVTGDMSYAAAKTVDIEVYLPGQDRYYEVSSVSNCRDFQARRSKIRYKKDQKALEFVHTLNGSGLATSRLMVALLENNQNEDGSVTLPKALRPYLDNRTHLSV